MKIGVLVIATRFYKDWLPQFRESVEENFFPDDDVRIFSYTDDDDGFMRISSYGFPDATLARYSLFEKSAPSLKEMDYLFYMDVDMRVVKPVGHEMLPGGRHDGLTVVKHAGFGFNEGTWETNPRSQAYSPIHQPIYFAGGLQGGRTDEFLAMSVELATKIEIDRSRGVQAIWHDESHLNCYMANKNPLVLPSEYCYPEERDEGQGKILCLYKDNSWKWKNETYPS